MATKKQFSHERLQEYGAAVRDLISQENELINNRMQWLNAIQGLLFAALAFVQDPNGTHGKLNAITFVIAAVGICVALNTMWRTYQADVAVNLLLRKWQRYVHNYNEYYNIIQDGAAWTTFEPVNGLRPGPEDENMKEDPASWDLHVNKCDTCLETFFLPWYSFAFIASWIAIIFITVYY